MASDTLANMVRNLRSEAGHSLAVSQGVNQVETLKYILKRTQEELHTAFVWPALKIRVNIPAVVGQQVYPFDATMPFEQIKEAWCASSNGTNWSPVGYGLTEDLIKPDGNNTQSGTPIQFYEVAPGGFRVWPTPSQAGTIRFVGQKPLAPFIADSDMSTLDATLIVLFAAAELLARAKAEDASVKMQKAQRHLTKLLAGQISVKNKVSTMGAYAGRSTPTPGIDYIPG
jgi:hypothetical protein